MRGEILLSGIGANIKHLRTSEGMTLKDLSAATGLSIGYLSQLERGLNSVAVDSLAKIAEALGVTLHYFISKVEGKQHDSVVVRSYEREAVFAENRHSIQYHLSADRSDKAFLARSVEILPSAEDNELISYRHEGEEFVYILEGVLTLHLNHVKHDLYPGDSAHYNSKAEHAWGNYTNKTVKFVSVHAPNLFRSETGADVNEGGDAARAAAEA